MLTPGQVVSLIVERPAVGGPMIARAGGQVVLVSGAIPGETVQARVERTGRGVAHARTIAIDVASADRRDAFEDPDCGGCLYGHIAYARQLEIKSQVIADAFQRIGRLPLRTAVAVAPSAEDGYRMRARLHARGHRFGFFREGTHDLCSARPTGQLLPSTCDALDGLDAAVQSEAIDGVRGCELSENIDASERVVFLDAVTEIVADRLERLAAGGGFTGLVSAQATRGSAYVTDRITIGDGTTVALRRHVRAFFQGNRHLLATLVAQVVAQVPAGGDVVDLYAGAGLFGVSAAVARGARVIAVEGEGFSAADLVVNSAQAAGAVTAVHQPVEEFLRRARAVPTVIVDPPRTGMSVDAVAGVARLDAGRVIYVSCDVATLARDARRLVDAGYAVDSVQAFDMFPNTPHVETQVEFRKA